MSTKTTTLQELLNANKFLTVSPKDTIRSIAQEMPHHHTSAAAVLNEDGEFIGLVTERDIVERAIAVKRNVDTTQVLEIMTPDPLTISLKYSIVDAADIMTKKGIRTMPVMDGEKFVGILDIRDLYDGMQNLLQEQIKIDQSLLEYAFGESYGGGCSKKA